MTKNIGRGFLLMFSLFLALNPATSFAQGPPITTDTPIMFGVSGRGLRTFGKIIHKATLLQNGNEINDPLDRDVTVWITPLAVPYNFFNDKFQIGVIAPFMRIKLNTNQGSVTTSGVGDIRLFFKYLLYQKDSRNKTFRIASKAGIKFPTGNENKQPALGTGSTDYFFSTVAGWIKSRVGIYLEGIYNLNTSRNQIKFGNSFSYNFSFGYRLLPVVYETYPSPQLNGFLEFNGVTAGKNQVNGQSAENSGGTILFFSPGLQYVGGRRWLIEASFQYPLVNEPNGTQLATDWTFSLGTRILIF